jgi:hypothetical protein
LFSASRWRSNPFRPRGYCSFSFKGQGKNSPGVTIQSSRGRRNQNNFTQKKGGMGMLIAKLWMGLLMAGPMRKNIVQKQ